MRYHERELITHGGCGGGVKTNPNNALDVECYGLADVNETKKTYKKDYESVSWTTKTEYREEAIKVSEKSNRDEKTTTTAVTTKTTCLHCCVGPRRRIPIRSTRRYQKLFCLGKTQVSLQLRP